MNNQQLTHEINNYIAMLDADMAYEIYLDDLERELYETGVKIGEKLHTRQMAEMAFIGSDEGIKWANSFISDYRLNTNMMHSEFPTTRAVWIRDCYVPMLAGLLRDEYDVECMGWE